MRTSADCLGTVPSLILVCARNNIMELPAWPAGAGMSSGYSR